MVSHEAVLHLDATWLQKTKHKRFRFGTAANVLFQIWFVEHEKS
jgi:hypothetical protein